ncbi:hypothetical protein Sango_0521900 [Sesamum angolense]|uniref:DUF1005 family protein n=1 Tax=Sesamum angolense TaxID=2727404 RepID=A0AAE2C131_9LAMI|nr:hypothetical protein Sango_0521900 [Sesamum angolense]
MDPCSFVRIVIGNLALKFPERSHLSSRSFYCKFKLKGFPTQVSDVTFLAAESDAVESRIQACFSLRKPELEKLADKSSKFSCLKIEVYRRSRGGSSSCGFVKSGKLLGCVALQLDLKSVLESNGNNRGFLIQNGWILVGGPDVKLHLNVRAEPDPRFVFQFDGEPECSPQVFQVNGICSVSGPRSTSISCFSSSKDDNEQPLKERKGWSITIHDLSGSPVAAASMVTPFVPSPGSDRVSRSNPGAWLILRPGQNTWKPWGRLEAWRDSNDLGYRFELIPDGGVDPIPLANSRISTKTGGKFSIGITTGPTPVASASSSFDLSSGCGSGSDFGSAAGSGSWAHLLYRGFVMSSTVEGDGKCSKPEVEVGVQHVNCTEDAAAFVALAAAMDLSLDACRLFSQKLRKELREPDLG